DRRAPSVHDDTAALSFFDLKGDVESVLGAFDLPGLKFEPTGPGYFVADRCGRMVCRGEDLATFGLLAKSLADDYKLRQVAWIAEIIFERLLEFPLRSRNFQPISKFPAVERDFSLVVPDEVPYASLSSTIEGLAIEELRGFRPVDRFSGGTIPAQHY